MLKLVSSNWAWGKAIQKRVNWYLTKLNYIANVNINGVVVRIPSINGISCDASEPWMVDLLAKLLPLRPGAFFDVGVNVGQTLVKVKSIDPDREYVGFEPNPTCIFYVQNLIKVNSFNHCTLLPVGLFTEDCVLSLDLFSDDATDSSASLIKNFRPGNSVRSRIFVPVFEFHHLTTVLDEKSVGLVKIDVEGAELEVVKSLLQMIKHDKPIILIELLPVYSHGNVFRKNRQEELEQILAGIDYAILRVEKTSANAFSGLTVIREIGVHSDLTRCDYVILPNVELAALQMTSSHQAVDETQI